jgi:hypothetical protein
MAGHFHNDRTMSMTFDPFIKGAIYAATLTVLQVSNEIRRNTSSPTRCTRGRFTDIPGRRFP